jgi:GNAT superfamily N-acetyltransferase
MVRSPSDEESHVRVTAVNGTKPEIAAMLQYLQLSCLPLDVPMDTSEGWWWIVFDGELPVAFAGLTRSQAAPESGYLCRAGVLPSYRGRGLQSRLLKARERKARQLGLDALVTDTFDNPPSSNNLIRAGFRLCNPPFPYGALGTNYWRKPLVIQQAAKEPP